MTGGCNDGDDEVECEIMLMCKWIDCDGKEEEDEMMMMGWCDDGR